MIRTTVKIDSETADALVKLLDEANELTPTQIEAIKARIDSEIKSQGWQQKMQALSAAYHRPASLLFPRFPISHPYKPGKWVTAKDVADKYIDDIRADLLKGMGDTE